MQTRDERIGKNGEHTEEKHIKSELHRRHAQRRLVHHHYVDGIAERGEHHEHHASCAERRTSVTMIKHGYARKGKHYGEHRYGGKPFLEQQRHDDSHHHRIDKKQRGGYAGIHETEAEIQRYGRRGEHHSERAKQRQFSPTYLQALSPRRHEHAEHHYSEREPVEQHRVGVYSVFIKIQRTQRIGAVTYGGPYAAQISFKFRLHGLFIVSILILYSYKQVGENGCHTAGGDAGREYGRNLVRQT